MTIFFEVFRELLIQKITQIREKSSAADNSMGNSFLTLFSLGNLGRDRNLSETKRNLADRMISELRIAESKKDDVENLNYFTALITTYKNAAAEASRKKGYPEGEFGTAMEDNIHCLNKLYSKIKLLDYIDTPHNQDPLHIFYYHASLYFGRKIYELERISTLKKVSQHPKLTAFAELSKLKYELLTKVLQDCVQSLDALADEPQDFVVRRNLVLTHLDELDQENKKLCKRYSKSINLPVTLALFVTVHVKFPALRPKNGLLGACIKEAREEILSSIHLSRQRSVGSELGSVF